MKENYTITKNYADAILETAKELNAVSDFGKQLDEIIAVIKNSSDLQVVMNNSAISGSKKIDIIDEIFNGKINQKLLNFLKILIKKNRFNSLDTINEIYKNEVTRLSNKQKVEITSPIPLNFENKTNVLFKLEHKLNCEVIPVWKVDKSLIAGLTFKIGDCVIDTSIRSKLEKLSKEIIK